MDSNVCEWLFPLKPEDLPGQFKVSCWIESLTTEFPRGPCVVKIPGSVRNTSNDDMWCLHRADEQSWWDTVFMWRTHSGCLNDLRSAFCGGNSLACSPRAIPCWDTSCTFTLGFGRLSFGLWGSSVTDKFTQELELGQEELPYYIPAWGVKKENLFMKIDHH